MPEIQIGDSALTQEEIQKQADQLYWELSEDNDLAAELTSRVKNIDLVESEEYGKKIARALREVHAINTREFLLTRASEGIAKERFKGLIEEAAKETKNVLIDNLQNMASVMTEKEKPEKEEEKEEEEAPSPAGFPGLQMSKKDQILQTLRR